MSKTNKLTGLVKYVKSNNDFYKELYSHIDGNDFDLQQLPILKRAYIKNNLSRMISSGYCIDELNRESTYGTTEGIPLKIYKSDRERIDLGISLWKYRRILNIEACKRHAYYYYNNDNPNAAPQIECGNDSVNIHFPVIKKSEMDYIKDLQIMIDHDIKWLICPPTVAFKISQLAIKYNVLPKLEMIEFLSEYVPRYYKESIEKIFNCNTCIEYGCHEIWGIAFTNKDNILTIMDNIILEKIKDNRFLNGYGRCVVTNLKLKSLPFIRYELNDLIDIQGNELRTYGFRSSDMVTIGDIKIHCSFFSNIFENNVNDKILPLEDYQIIYNDTAICLCLCNKDESYNEIFRKYLELKLIEFYQLDVKVRAKKITSFITDTFTGKMKGIVRLESLDIL